MIHDKSSFDIRQAGGHQGSRGLWQPLQVVRRQGSASSWPRAAAARAGLPNTMCWPAFRRARSAASPISSPASRRAASSADCRWRCAAAATTPSSLYPAYGAFMSARGFHTTTGIQHFLRRTRSRRQGRRARQLLLRQGRERLIAGSSRPTRRCSPSSISPPIISPGRRNSVPSCCRPGAAPGNEPVVDEYLRRQAHERQRLRERSSRA